MAHSGTRSPLAVHWYKSESSQWLKLKDLDLTHSLVKQRGVYIVFVFDALDVLYVGQGYVAQRLEERKRDRRILELADLDELCVTWARIAGEAKRKGVERFLADTLIPLVGEHPKVPPIAVNVPPLLE